MLTSAMPIGAFAADPYAVKKGSFTYMPSFADEAATEDYYFSDSYFFKPSDQYDIHLTSVSMALSLSTMQRGRYRGLRGSVRQGKRQDNGLYKR